MVKAAPACGRLVPRRGAPLTGTTCSSVAHGRTLAQRKPPNHCKQSRRQSCSRCVSVARRRAAIRPSVSAHMGDGWRGRCRESGRLVPLVDARERECRRRSMSGTTPGTTSCAAADAGLWNAAPGTTSCARRRVLFFFLSLSLFTWADVTGLEHGWWVLLSSHWSVWATGNGVDDDESTRGTEREPVTTVAFFAWRRRRCCLLRTESHAMLPRDAMPIRAGPGKSIAGG